MKRSVLTISSLLLVGVEAASGEVSFQLIDRGTPTDGVRSAAGYTGYTLRLISDNGPISAIDLSSGINGIFGPFVQRWTASGEDGTYATMTPGFIAAQNLSPSPMNFDSHLLPPGEAFTVFGPIEDAAVGLMGSEFGSFPANTSSAGFGPGTRVAASYGLLAPNQPWSFDAAYLVIPNGGAIAVHGKVVVGARVNLFDLNTARAWKGPGRVWDSDPSNKNWRCWGEMVAFNPGNEVQFTDAGLAGVGEVQVAAAGVAPHHLSFSHSSGTYAFSGGPINSTGLFIKRGNGAVTFDNPVSAAGTIVIGSGVVRFNNLVSTSTLTALTDDASGRWPATLSGTGTINAPLHAGTFSNTAPGAADQLGTLTVQSIFFQLYSSVSFRFGALGSDRLVVTQANGVTFRDPNLPVTCSLSELDNASQGTYVVLDYAGSSLPATRFKLVTPTVGPFVASLVNNTSNTSIDVRLDPGPAWQRDSDGDWFSSPNWANGIPNAPGAVATFGPVISSPRTVSIASGGSDAGSIRFNSPVPYTLAGPDKFYLTTDYGGPAEAIIDVLDGSHTISAPLRLLDTTVIRVRPASAQLTLSGPIDYFSLNLYRHPLTKTGAGTLRLTGDSTFPGSTTISQGTLVMNGTHSSAGSYNVSRDATLAGSGTISALVCLDPGAQIAPGDMAWAPATLTVGELSLTDALLSFDLTSSGADRIVVTDANALLLQGVSSISVSGDITQGAFTLIDYSGAPLTDSGRLVLGVTDQIGLPVSLSYNSSNTSIDLLVGSASVPEPGSLLFVLDGALCRRARRHRAPTKESVFS
jgi:autotransporter-associated beta strand protein